MRVPARVLRSISGYVALERQNALVGHRPETDGEPQVVGADARSCWVAVEGRRFRVRLARMTPAHRLAAVEVDESGRRAPMALWLGEGGAPVSPRAWEAVFERASARCRALGHAIDASPHTLRHTFAVHMLSLLIREQIASVEGAAPDPATAPYRRLLGDPLQHLQRLLGHRSVATTYIYLDSLAEAQWLVDDAIDRWSRRDRLGGRRCRRLVRPCPRGRRRVTFDPDTEPEDSTITSVGFLKHTLVFEGGGKIALDYTDLPCPRLVRHLTAAFARRAGVGGGHITAESGRTYSTAIRAFIVLHRRASPGPDRFHRRRRSHAPPISTPSRRRSEVDCRATAQRPTSSWAPWCDFFAPSPRTGRVALRPDLLARLDFVANGLKGHTTPRDAYSPAETAQLRAACRADILAIVDRLTVTGEQRLATGREPDGQGWRVAENVMWHIDRNGPISLPELRKHQGRMHPGFPHRRPATACSIPRAPTSCRSCCCSRWRAASRSRRARPCGRTASARPRAAGSRCTTASAGPAPISGDRFGCATPGCTRPGGSSASCCA